MDLGKDLKGYNVEKVNFSSIIGFFVNFLVPLACLLITAGLAFIVLLPSYREIPSLENTLQIEENLAVQLETKASTLLNMVDIRDTMEDYTVAVDLALTSEPKIPELLSQVDRMAGESGMEVTSLSYSRGSRSASDDGYNDVGIALTTSGTFPRLLDFMARIERASRLVLVDDIRYSSKREDEGIVMSINYRLHSPYLSVTSDAVTDEPILLDIFSQEFLDDMETLQKLTYYDISQVEAEPFDDPAFEQPLLNDLEEDQENGSPFGGGFADEPDEPAEPEPIEEPVIDGPEF